MGNKFKSVFREIQDCVELNLEDFTVSGSLTLLLDPCLAQLPFEKMFSSKLGSRPSSKKEFSHIQRDFSVDIFQSRQKYYANQPDTVKKDSKEAVGKNKKGGGSTTSLKNSDTTNFIMVSDRKIPLNTKRSVIQNETFSSKIYDSPGELTDSQLSQELKTSKHANIFYQPSGLHKKECGELNCIDFVKLAANSVSKGVAQLSVLMDGGLSSPDAVILLGQFLGHSSFMSSLRSLDFDKSDLVISESVVGKVTEVDNVENSENLETVEEKVEEEEKGPVETVRLPTLDLAIKLSTDGCLTEYKQDLEAMQKDDLDWSVFYGNVIV